MSLSERKSIMRRTPFSFIISNSFSVFAEIIGGRLRFKCSCIFNEQENLDYEACEDGSWSHHTCINPADSSPASSWNGSQTTCENLGYDYTSGSCDLSSDDGGNDG